MLYPEGLEMSNLISILNEDLSFNITDCLKLKEIQKLYQSKELLIPVSKTVKIKLFRH